MPTVLGVMEDRMDENQDLEGGSAHLLTHEDKRPAVLGKGLVHNEITGPLLKKKNHETYIVDIAKHTTRVRPLSRESLGCMPGEACLHSRMMADD